MKKKEIKFLPIVEDFYTLQGEGFHTGKAAYFIRIGGCDIACSFCDTKFSWNADLHKKIKIDNLLEKIKKKSVAKSIVVTGGEPLKYNLNYFCEKFKENNFLLFIETSGNYELSGNWDWICLSPKKKSPPKKEIFAKADELKVIIENLDDLLWAEENAKKVNKNCKLFLQSEWSKKDFLTNSIVEYIKKNPKWAISIQTHKYLNIP